MCWVGEMARQGLFQDLVLISALLSAVLCSALFHALLVYASAFGACIARDCPSCGGRPKQCDSSCGLEVSPETDWDDKFAP